MRASLPTLAVFLFASFGALRDNTMASSTILPHDLGRPSMAARGRGLIRIRCASGHSDVVAPGDKIALAAGLARCGVPLGEIARLHPGALADLHVTREGSVTQLPLDVAAAIALKRSVPLSILRIRDLSSVSGVGPVLGGRLHEAIRKVTFLGHDFDSCRLTQVRGIGPRIAERIRHAFSVQRRCR